MSKRGCTIPSKTKTCTSSCSIQMKLVFGRQQLFQPATTSHKTTTGEQQRAHICHEQHNISETESKTYIAVEESGVTWESRHDKPLPNVLPKQHAHHIKCEPQEIPLKINHHSRDTAPFRYAQSKKWQPVQQRLSIAIDTVSKSRRLDCAPKPLIIQPPSVLPSRRGLDTWEHPMVGLRTDEAPCQVPDRWDANSDPCHRRRSLGLACP